MEEVLSLKNIENAIIEWHAKHKNELFEYNTGERVVQLLNIAHEINSKQQISYGKIDISENNISYDANNMIMTGIMSIPYKLIFTENMGSQDISLPQNQGQI